MLPHAFAPYPVATQARAAGRFTCTHFHGRLLTEHVVCEKRGGVQVIRTPRYGCAFWEREAGSDDE